MAKLFQGFGKGTGSGLGIVWDLRESDLTYVCGTCGQKKEGPRYIATTMATGYQSAGIKCPDCYNGRSAKNQQNTQRLTELPQILSGRKTEL
ncbi:MAG: hypothetical protein ACYCX4_06925 [Bacillota bacterium]